MKGWTKLNSFDSVIEAELQKEIMESNGIPAVILQHKDSTFLWGDIELYVEDRNFDMASALINEFEGFTRINSFFRLYQVELMKNYIEAFGIKTLIYTKADHEYLADNFELFVSNDDAEQARKIVEAMKGWSLLDSFTKLDQIEIRINILAEKQIDAIVVKQRDSNLHVEKLMLYVEEKNHKAASAIIEELAGWVLVDRISQVTNAEILNESLLKKEIPSVMKRVYDSNHVHFDVELYVMEHHKEEAIELLVNTINWVKINTLTNIYPAELCREMLAQENIQSIIIVKNDSAFLLGEIELYVLEENVDRAVILLREFEESGNYIPYAYETQGDEDIDLNVLAASDDEEEDLAV